MATAAMDDRIVIVVRLIWNFRGVDVASGRTRTV
jgi:hypothetical protein